MKVVCILTDPRFAPKVAESCYRITPQIACGLEGAVFLEISQCLHLFNEKTILARLQVLLKKLSLTANIAVGPDPGAALALAKYKGKGQRDLTPKFLPIAALREYANPFSQSQWDFYALNKMIQTLEQIGVFTIGRFLELPKKDISSRFGAIGLTLFNRALGVFDTPWPRFQPEEKIKERLEWAHDNPCGDFDSISFLLKTIVERASTRTFGRGFRILSFVLKLEIEKHSFIKESTLTWNFNLPLPQGHSKTILALIRDQLSYDFSRKPLASPVLAAEVEVLDVAPALSRQRDLLNPHGEDAQEAWNSLAARLTRKLGPSDVFVAKPMESYLPEKSWTRISAPEVATHSSIYSAPLPERPSRIFSSPKPVDIISNRIVFNEISWRILAWEGPEVLAGEWWEESFERIYFKVSTDTGEQLWIYRNPTNEKVYLHGFFD